MGDTLEAGSWRKPYKTRGPSQDRHEVCSAHALSLFDNVDRLTEVRKLNPWARTKSVALVELGPGCGKLLETPSDLADGHHDYWPNPLDYYPAGVVVIEAEDE